MSASTCSTGGDKPSILSLVSSARTSAVACPTRGGTLIVCHSQAHLAFDVGDAMAEVDELVPGLLALGAANTGGGQLGQARAQRHVGAGQGIDGALKISDCVSMIPMIEPEASAKQHERSDRGDQQLRDLLQRLVGDALPGGECRVIARHWRNR